MTDDTQLLQGLTAEQLTDLLYECQEQMNALLVNEHVPQENQKAYHLLQQKELAIEVEMERRWGNHPTIADQDTTHTIQ